MKITCLLGYVNKPNNHVFLHLEKNICRPKIAALAIFILHNSSSWALPFHSLLILFALCTLLLCLTRFLSFSVREQGAYRSEVCVRDCANMCVGGTHGNAVPCLSIISCIITRTSRCVMCCFFFFVLLLLLAAAALWS